MMKKKKKKLSQSESKRVNKDRIGLSLSPAIDSVPFYHNKWFSVLIIWTKLLTSVSTNAFSIQPDNILINFAMKHHKFCAIQTF